jgi:hypothetical protein
MDDDVYIISVLVRKELVWHYSGVM